MHSQYTKSDDNTFENDLALIVIEGALPSRPNIQPICLPKFPINYNEEDDVIVLGWGQLSPEEGNTAQRLQMLERPRIPIQDCESVWKKNFVPSEKICMGKGGHNICKGDEGGPLMVENSHGRFVLVGIASFSGPVCGDRFPGVYSNFEFYRDWVKQNSIGTSCSK